MLDDTYSSHKLKHQITAHMIRDVVAQQVGHAKSLGEFAAQIGIDQSENPFQNLLNPMLESAWGSGWVQGYKGSSL